MYYTYGIAPEPKGSTGTHAWSGRGGNSWGDPGSEMIVIPDG